MSKRFLSWAASVALHLAVLGIALYVPKYAKAPRLNLNVPVYQVSLVNMGDLKPGAGQPKPVAATPPAPAAPPAPAPAPAPPKAVPIKEQPKPVEKEVPKPKPEVKPEPKPEEKAISPKKVETPKQPEPKPQEKNPPPEPKKETPPKKPEKPALSDAQLLAEALKSAKQEAKTSNAKAGQAQTQTSSRQELAKELAALQKEVGKSGIGGGEGEGGGVGEATLSSVYAALVEAEIKKNWRYPSIAGRDNPVTQVQIRLDKDGRILEYALVRSSGRPEFDASAIKAIQKTQQLPPPPKEELQELIINFNLQESL